MSSFEKPNVNESFRSISVTRASSASESERRLASSRPPNPAPRITTCFTRATIRAGLRRAVAECRRGRIPEVEGAATFLRDGERFPVLIEERSASPRTFLGPARHALGLLLRGAPEEARALEVAAAQRDLREAGQRVERPQPVLVCAHHLECGQALSLRTLEIAQAEGEHEKLVPLARLPPRPADGPGHLRASLRELDRAFDLAVDDRELAEQPVAADLDELKPALGE